MKKIFAIAAITAAAFTSSSNAQILYKVEKNGSDKVSYILGTHHFAPMSSVDKIEKHPSILRSVEKLYGELDMEQMSNPAIMMSMQQSLVAPADSTLDKILTPAQLDSLKVVWNDYTGGQAPIEMMFGVKPSVISTQLAVLMGQRVLPELNPLEGIDNTMQTRAKELGIPVGGLETMDFQIDMLYNRPVAEQAESLMEIVRDAKGEEEKAIRISEAYLNHNIDEILKVMAKEEQDDPETLERILFSRNANWVGTLKDEMADRSLMVVVGAGHLGGNRGVLELLRKEGYTVTPVE